MLYHPDGNTRVVDSPDEHEQLRKQGWAQEPLPIHQRPVVSHTPVAGGSDPIGMLLRSVIESVLDERGLTKEHVAHLVASRSAAASDPPEGEALDSPAAPFLPDKRSRHHG